VRIPTSALIFREHGTEVATIGPGDRIELKPVTLGRNLGTEVEILKGLTLFDRVVNSPPDSLSAGDVVHIAAQQAGANGSAWQPPIRPRRTWRRRRPPNNTDEQQINRIGSGVPEPVTMPRRPAMALKDLLVYLDQTENSFLRLRLAADLAIRHEGHLTALYVREWNREKLDRRKSVELGLVSRQWLHRLDETIEASIEEVAERLRSILTLLARERGVDAELRCVDGVAATVVAQSARYADLCILGPDEPEGPTSVEYTFSEQLLFVTGRPVLFVPDVESTATLGRHVVVAWNLSRSAARALNDALPLIERADRTTIVMVNPSGFIDKHHGLPGEQLIEHLRRHGAAADQDRECSAWRDR
jgi:nucleotide-binding universal stress UspA family protein